MDLPLTPGRLSDLIGAIYDCAVEPDRWPDVMARICSDLDCMMSAIILVDLVNSQHRFLKQWNIGPFWSVRHAQYNEDMTLLYKSSNNAVSGSVDEPLVLSRDIPEKLLANIRYYREWAQPQGICDSVQAIVLRSVDRIGVFAANRHESVGFATDREIAILRLLAPHIRRAVTISDLMDLKTLETRALAAALDRLALGVVIVAEDSRILHANEGARRMLAAGAPVRALGGRLSVRGAAGAELARALALARSDEAAIGAAGIGVALPGRDGAPALAHVLPLAHGDVRTRLMPQATAAVFITQAAGRPALEVSAIAATFGLTPRESGLLARLAAGASLAEAAAMLGIAETTAKTHLGNIFAKTGVARQADLIALVHRLTPPVGAPDQDRA